MATVEETVLSRKEKEQAKVAALRELEHPDGRIVPEEVVDAARDPDSPLHSSFPWDDATAAHAHRLNLARELIRWVKFEVIINDEPVRTVRYVSDPAQDAAMYLSVPKIRRQGEARGVMAGELARIVGNMERTIGLARVKAALLPANLSTELQRLRDEVVALLADCRR